MRNRRNTRRKNVVLETITNKNFMIISAILLIIIIALLGIIQYRRNKDKMIIAKQAEELEKQSEAIFAAIDQTLSEKITSTRPSVAKIAAVGDILCHEDMIEDANVNDSYNFSSMFANVTKFTKKSDLALGTLETNFIEGKSFSGKGKYNSPLEFLTAIKESGINLLSVAHNHELDYGTEGLNETVQKVQEQDLSVTGIRNNKENEDKDFTGVIKEVKGIKIAFLSYTYGLSNEKELSEEEKSTANIYSEETAKKDLEYAKQNSNYIIAIMHWGDISSTTPSEYQKGITTFLVENGIDMILGTHPVVVQPMEIIQNSEGKNILVAYSLGNYISTLKSNNADVEIILNIQIAKSVDSDKAVLQKVDYTPVYLLDNGIKAENRFELTDMKQIAREYANGDTSKISRKTYDKIVQKLDELQKVVNNK